MVTRPVFNFFHLLPNLLGSFWVQILNKGRIELSTTTLRSSVHNQVDNISEWVKGDKWIKVSMHSLRFKNKQVFAWMLPRKKIVTGFKDGENTQSSTVYSNIALENSWKYHAVSLDGILTTPGGETILLPSEDVGVTVSNTDAFPETGWVIHVPEMEVEGLIPESIMTSEGVYMLGVDYKIGKDFLFFREHPSALFPENIITVRAGRQLRKSFFSYPTSTDTFFSRADIIGNYVRERQGLPELFLAAATAGGLEIVDKDSKLEGISQSGSSLYSYIFEDYRVDVDYPHNAMIEEFVPAKTVIGNVFRMYTPKRTVEGGLDRWHRESIDWSAGLSLKDISMFPDVTLADERTGAWSEGETEGNQLARFYLHTGDSVLAGIDEAILLENDPEKLEKLQQDREDRLTEIKQKENRFWSIVRKSEKRTGKYLNSIIGLESADDIKPINPIDVVFSWILSKRGVVFEIESSVIGSLRTEAITNFIRRERPLGVIPIIIER